MITTKSIGIGEDTSDPKPVRGINWCGQPINEGEDYWGKIDRQPVAVEPVAKDMPKPHVKRVKRSWTATQLEAMRERMAKARAAAKAKRSAAQSATTGET